MNEVYTIIASAFSPTTSTERTWAAAGVIFAVTVGSLAVWAA